MLASVTWKIGGEAGFGIMSAGTMLSKTFARNGYHVFATNEYPSLIRGGHNLITVRVATEKFESMNRDVHILVALNYETVTIHKDELSQNALVVYDPKDKEVLPNEFKNPVKLIAVPLSDITTEQKGEKVMRNTVALGATLALMGADLEWFSAVIRDQFGKKGEEIVAFNIAIAKAGYDYVKKQYSGETSMHLNKTEKKPPMAILNASEAIGIGAVRAGLKFAAIYPMTPINSLITFLADHAKSLGIVYKQPEDEIAGINMAIGASVAGARSMVATSGGGFALMVEGVSLAGMIEAPVVIDLGMRVGPATGMPTWTEQGELQFVIHAGHGEFPRIVLAPADAAECYSSTVEAFHLADKFQIPVFILTDKYINESQFSVPVSHFTGEVKIERGKLLLGQTLPSDGSFMRYDTSVSDGVSPRSVPGMAGGQYFANSYEHDGKGFVTEKAEGREKMAEKRLRKFEAIKKEIEAPSVYGDANAEITFVTWGSTKGPVMEAMKMLKAKGKSSRVVHFRWVYPFPGDAATPFLSGGRVIDVEQNATGQLASLIREHTGIVIKEKILKYDGRPFYPEEIVGKVG